jgi:hypothetical protein
VGAMTYEELKLEAEKQGYTLTKKITYEKMQKCICGKYPYQEISIKPKGKYFRCANCGFKSEICRWNYQAIANWNKAVEKANENIKKYNPKCIGGNVRPIRAKEEFKGE